MQRAPARRRALFPGRGWSTLGVQKKSACRAFGPSATHCTEPRERNMKRVAIAAAVTLFGCLTFDGAHAQGAAFPPPPPKVSPAKGVIDMHVHSHPDVFGRNMDDIDVAQLAKSRGMRGILIKNHISETASRAALVMKVVPGIEVYGGIVLNSAVGGVNPTAVEWMHRFYGSRGKVVRLPAFESDKHVKTFGKPDAKGLMVAPNGPRRTKGAPPALPMTASELAETAAVCLSEGAAATTRNEPPASLVPAGKV